jgi:hypothetical protein
LLFFSNSEGFAFYLKHLNLRGLKDLKGHSTFAVFSNSEGLDFNHHHVDLRGLKDLKGHSTFEVWKTAKVVRIK